MDWYDRKSRKMIVRAVWLLVLLTGTYLLYSYYKAWNLSDYEMQNSYTGAKPADSARRSENRSLAIRQPENTGGISKPDSQTFVYTHINSSFQPAGSAVAQPTVSQQKIKPGKDTIKNIKTSDALQAPSAVFSREYTIGIGKTVPVTILWESSGANAVNYKLVTIKADDIVNKKAMFTIEDPFNVLVFSQTGYGEGDKIIIDDEKHNISLSIVQVNPSSVVVKLVSHLNESIVSGLQKAD